MRRLVPWWLLALLFVVVPVLEIYVLIQVGQVIGAWWTVLLLIASGFAGSWLVKREGGRAWRALQEAIAEHRVPAKELADGALILIGGTLLLTPGFLSDIVGAFAILPFTRPVARAALTGVITRKFVAGADVRFGYSEARARQSPGHDGVVRGEVVDD
ncbi:FxsA family protein [Nocardioides iriomotensis]|uniref:FxsA family protein n=1 Tax=Nocardioides iriomotensis TaxID=715784 RepID=A0A4Q5J281_9ACTN|nr:FxsA family protein [Nocardioides iriomotensis]RYU11579.1 FxsA family protein [Nocardioides iriomotensis]